jgi:hypothetical protein
LGTCHTVGYRVNFGVLDAGYLIKVQVHGYGSIQRRLNIIGARGRRRAWRRER